MVNSPNLWLNLIPIVFNQSSFNGYELTYQDDEQLKVLRKTYRETHVFRRQHNIIQCVPICESAEALGVPKQFTLQEDFVLAEYLVQDALIRFFHSRNYSLAKLYHPITVVITRENLLTAITDSQELASQVALYPEYQIESRLIVPDNKQVIFGILINFSVCQIIKASVKELAEQGVEIINRYVTRNKSLTDTLLDPQFNRELAGKIININGTQLQLTDFRDDLEIDANTCFLEPNPNNLSHCLKVLTKENSEKIQRRRIAQVFQVTGAKNQYERLSKLKDWFIKKQPISCAGGLSVTLADHLYQPLKGNEVGEYRSLSSPIYVLRPGGTPVRGLIDEAIDINGPFDTESFHKKQLKIALVFPERFRGEVDVFVKQFKDGVPSQEGKKIPYTQGFVRKYRLTKCEFMPFAVERNAENSKGYKDVSLEALSQPTKYDLALIVIKEDWHSLYGESNPYLVAKSTFMSQGIPVQCIEIETIQDERGQPWILNNLALAIYAKLGGIPWVLSYSSGITHELILGIGSAKIQTKRLGESERFVGITTVFNGEGNYLLYNLTKEVRYENYQEALLQSLQSCLQEVKVRYGWQTGDSVRLIFHQSFKKFKNIEALAVKQLVDSISDFDVKYAFVHISKSHPWKILDSNSEGEEYWDRNERQKLVKGEYVPQRGFSIPLGPKAALLSLTGPRQLKTAFQGCPEPILISIHEESTFFSQEYLINQIYKLTFMSWRDFFPSTMPVTVEYSDLIAKMMGQLRAIPNWNPDILNTKLRESRWFL